MLLFSKYDSKCFHRSNLIQLVLPKIFNNQFLLLPEMRRKCAQNKSMTKKKTLMWHRTFSWYVMLLY